MHALVGVWTAAPGRIDGEGAPDPLMPTACALPGFVEGYWTLDAETGKLHSFIVFEDEPAVWRLKTAIEGRSGDQARAGLSYDRLSVVEVRARTSREVS
jgi:hypothetical protein